MLDLPDCVWSLLDVDRERQFRLRNLPFPEELRFRIGWPCSILSGGASYQEEGPPVTAEELDRMVERAVKASFYAYQNELRRGFLHLSSGVRLGVCGVIYEQNGIAAGIRAASSVSIRIPREIPSCADEVFGSLSKDGFRSTLIISPPGYGKTTLLRSLIQRLSESGNRVAIADERGEIAAVSDRMFGFQLGPNTDVMSGGTKAETSMMLLRAMNPQILAFDEITSPTDIAMISQAAGCGVSLLATAHGLDRASMIKRALYRRLFEAGIFENLIRIQMVAGKRRYLVETI